MLLSLLAACKTPASDPVDTAPAAERLSKSAPLTETATPNKPATPQAADVETQDLDSLRAELNSLNSDLSKIKTDLSGSEPQRLATQDVVPDTQISTPRALASDGVLSIPDSKQELAEKDIGTVRAVRVGTHEGGKKRLVIEISGSGGKPKAVLTEKTLVIQLPRTEMMAAEQQLSSLNDQLGVSKASKEKDDTIVTIQLHDNATIAAQMMLPAAQPGQGQRFVVDLAPAL